MSTLAIVLAMSVTSADASSIDALLEAEWKKHNVQPAASSTDDEFV